MLTDEDIAHYRTHGWLRIVRAFDAQDAAAMRDAVWAALAAFGIQRDQPRSWTVERPAHLQKLKQDSLFGRVASPRLRAAISGLLDGGPYPEPGNMGALFIAFPGRGPWEIPVSGWHIDARYTSPLWPAGGIKTFALLGDVAPRGGGTLFVSGSHRLVHRWFEKNPPPPGARSADMRKLLLGHSYLRDLHSPSEPGERIARFMEQVEEEDGVPLQVVEQTGSAGDVLLVHPLVMHVAAPNVTAQPRFLLSGGITTDNWGWAS